MVMAFFQKVLALVSSAFDESSISRKWVLDWLSDSISPVIKAQMEVCITCSRNIWSNEGNASKETMGLDGIPSNWFYLLFHNLTIPLLGDIYNHVCTYGKILEEFLNGDIVLILKHGDPTSPHNKRPITLLNSCYKIFTELWQLQLSLAAKSLIAWNQSTFLEGHSIHQTMLLCNKVLYFARSNSLQLDFLHDIFLWLGFGNCFSLTLAIIINSLSSQLLVNKRQGRTFQLTKAIRQGCTYPLYYFSLQCMCSWIVSHLNNKLAT